MISAMMHVQALGGLSLSRDRVTDPWPQRGSQRANLLLLLVGAGARGVDRSVAAGLLWPDVSEDRARHSLDELLSRSRRELREDNWIQGTSVLSLNPRVVTSDVSTFEDAMAARNLERAVACYRGPFGGELQPRQSTSLAQRLLASRERLARLYRDALTTLSRDALRRGDHHRAREHLAAWVTEEPLNAMAVLSLAEVLTVLDHRAEADRIVAMHTRLAADAGIPLSAELVAWKSDPTRVTSGSRPMANVAPRGPDATPRDAAIVAARRRAEIQHLLGADYRLRDVIESGTSWNVFAANQEIDGRAQVEVHVLQPTLAAASHREHFDAVLSRVCRLAHPHLTPAIEQRSNDSVFLVVAGARRGTSLRDRIRAHGPLGITEALVIARCVADVLAYVHREGVPHGDLRPRHIRALDSGATVTNTGFTAAALPKTRDETRSTLVTMGSPRYQSPERRNGATGATPADDVYALGSVLCEMLVGTPPAMPASDAGLRQDTPAPMRLRLLRATITEEIDQLISHCLAPYAADRPASHEVLRRLGAILPGR